MRQCRNLLSDSQTSSRGKTSMSSERIGCRNRRRRHRHPFDYLNIPTLGPTGNPQELGVAAEGKASYGNVFSSGSIRSCNRNKVSTCFDEANRILAHRAWTRYSFCGVSGHLGASRRPNLSWLIPGYLGVKTKKVKGLGWPGKACERRGPSVWGKRLSCGNPASMCR